jgi:MoaA/NifB/PqqE/SkfB family radical SAM enzyme
MTEQNVAQRIETRKERVHLSIGAVCNNNCLFCMEEDRDGRYVNNSAMTMEKVRWILEQHRGAEEVCFTSGEPTTREDLKDMLELATSLGFDRLSVMTNGRRLSHLPYAASLVKRGLKRFYVSIHGHDEKLHEGLTRTPGSFAQTVAGLDSLAKLKRFGVEVHTSTVLTNRNLPFLTEIYRFLRRHGVDQVVFNVMQANGRANTFFDQIFPTYAETAAQFRKFIAEVGEPEPMAFLVDIPLCTTEGIPDFNRGYVEACAHYDTAENAILDGFDAEAKKHDNGLVLISRKDLDDATREKRAECKGCKYDAQCEGVWKNYVKRRGWDEMKPVVD